MIEADELWLENLAEILCISDHRTLIRVFDTFAEVNLISPQLWADHHLHVEAIVERGDEYIRKKSLNAERQSRFRAKPKAQEDEEKRVSNALRNAESNDVTPSEIRDHIQNSEFIDQNSKELRSDQYTDLSLQNDQDPIDAEIIDLEPVKGQSQPDSAESQIVETKSSAAAPKPISKTPFLNDFYTLYNDLRPNLWSRVMTSSQCRERGIDRLLRSCGNDKSEAFRLLRDALNYCRQDQWWGTKNLGLDNLLSKNYLISNAERWEVLQSNPGMPRTLEILSDPKQAKFQRDLSIGMDKVREIEARKLAEMAAANGDDF